jgi:hypothetical protein
MVLRSTPETPEWLGPVEWLAHDSPRQELELLVAPGPGEAGVTNVVFEVEVVVVDPDRAVDGGDECQALAVARDVLQLAVDVRLDPFDVDPAFWPLQRARLKDRHPGYMHVGGGGLQRQK